MLSCRDPPVELVELGGLALYFHLEAACRLVDEVDGLIGEKARGDVAVREHGRGDESLVLYAHPVVNLVALLQAAEDGHGVFNTRLAGEHRLESPLEGSVFLDVLAILIECRRTDGAELSTGKRGLQQVGGVHRALRTSRAHEGVELVDEEDDLSVGLGDLVNDRLEALLELTAKLRPRHQRAEVELEDALVFEGIGHVAADHPLGEPLDDGRLSHARIADEDGVVLGASGEHLHDAADLLVTADDRVELVAAGETGEVAAVLVEHLVAALGILIGHALVSPDGLKRLQYLVFGEAFVL